MTVISAFKDLHLSSQGQGSTIRLKSRRSTYQPPLELDFIFELIYFHERLIFVRQVLYVYDRHSLPTEEANVFCQILKRKHLKTNTLTSK